MHALQDFMTRFDFVHMQPDSSVIIETSPKGVSARALVQSGKAYGLYLHTPAKDEVKFDAEQVKITLNLPAGNYRAEWVSTRTGDVEKTETFKQDAGNRTLAAPGFTDDIALAVQAF